MKAQPTYDVIIIGSGIGGSILATILAKHGHRVLILEKGQHPRFAIGESVVFRTSLWFWILGHLYDIPEIAYLANLDDIAEHVSPNCGYKLTFGFLYHREGQTQAPAESHKLIPPLAHFIRETHLYREDVDHFMVRTAQQYGADYLDAATVQSLDFDEGGVAVTLEAGQPLRARYLVDAAGFRSPVAEQFNLRDTPTRARTDSRSIFTHMRGVKPYDATVPADHLPPGFSSWHEGTLHHVFDGGWMWVIPFDNHDLTRSDLCSVGLMLDPRKFPARVDLTPAEEFNSIVAQFPTIRQHLAGAEAVRAFIRTGRIQYSSRQTVGDRYCLLQHAAAFIDPLYSRGMIRTFETLYALAPRLMEALTEDDLSAERFAYIEQMQQFQFERTDLLVHNAYRAMGSFETWNAWTQLWMGNEVLNGIYLWRRALKYIKTGDRDHLLGLDEAPKPGMGAPFAPALQALYTLCDEQLTQVEAGTLTPAEAAAAMYSAIGQSPYLFHPAYRFGDPATTHVDFVSPKTLGRTIWWGKFRAPQAIRESVFDLPLSTIARVEVRGRLRPLYARSLRKKLKQSA